MATNKIFFSVDLPEALGEQIERSACAENKTSAEFVQEAIERQLLLKRHQALQTLGQSNAHENGFTEDDVPRLIAESRAETAKREQ